MYTNWELADIIDKKEKKGGILKWSRDFIFQNTLNNKGNTLVPWPIQH
jgi:hypothetical protein